MQSVNSDFFLEGVQIHVTGPNRGLLFFVVDVAPDDRSGCLAFRFRALEVSIASLASLDAF